MNAKEIADKLRTSQQIARLASIHEMADVFESVAEQVESLVPRYRPPQPSDDGRYCFLEELPSDAPPTLVQLRTIAVKDDTGLRRKLEKQWQYWTLAGWRELNKGVWPCERPEGDMT